MIAEGLVALLTPLAQCFPVLLPERKGRPAITYRLISETRQYHHGGASGIVKGRYQIAAHADTHQAALNLSRELRKLLSAYEGPLGAGARAAHIQIDNVFDLGYSVEAESWQVTSDAVIMYLED